LRNNATKKEKNFSLFRVVALAVFFQSRRGVSIFNEGQTLGQVAPFSQGLGEYLAHDAAGLDNLGSYEAIVDRGTLPAASQDTLLSHHRQVLGQIGLGHPQGLHHIPHRKFPFFQEVQNPQSLGVGQGLADIRLQLEQPAVVEGLAATRLLILFSSVKKLL